MTTSDINKEQNMAKRTVVVTGGSSGIGAATVERFSAEGATIIVLDRSEPSTSAATNVHWIETDLSERSSVEAAVSHIGNVDVLCNVAGVSGTGAVPLTVAVNFLAVRSLVEGLAARISRNGAVVNVASTAGWRWRNDLKAVDELIRTDSFESGLKWAETNIDSGYQAYERSKQAVIVWSSIAAQANLGRFRVNSVSPGPIETPLLEEFYDSMGHAELDPLTARGGRNGRPDEIAEVVHFLTTPASNWINGTDIVVDAGAEMAEHLAAEGVMPASFDQMS